MSVPPVRSISSTSATCSTNRPTHTDPSGESYAFEKGATKFTGEGGWADVWRRNCFAWEYKKKCGDLDAA